MQNSIKVLALAALVVGAYACAEETSVSQRTLEDRVIQAYITKNKITTTPTASGLYLDVVKEGTGATPTATDWVLVKFTGKTLDDDYFHTTDTTVFQNLGYNLNYYHVVPDYLYMSGAIPQGIREALYTMKEGGKVNILMPSYIGFGSYGAVKFGQMPLLPSASVQSYTPVKYQLELVKVVAKPTEYDSLRVLDYAKGHAGFVAVKDTTKYFIKEIEHGSTAAADTIGNGSVVKVFYAGYFLDPVREGNVPADLVKYNHPYCFDTNIQTVADEYYPYKVNYTYSSSSGYTLTDTMTVTMAANNTSIIKGFDIALRNLRNGSKAEVVFSADYGYSYSGNSSSDHKPSIPPYTPLRFYIEVVKVTNSTSTSTSSSIAKPNKNLMVSRKK